MAERKLTMENKNIIEIHEVYWNTLSLFQKVNVRSLSQRALLGYMFKKGYTNNPIYGGAFSLLRDFESYVGIPLCSQKTKSDEVAMRIHDIADKAKLGYYDRFALSIDFIRETKIELEEERKRGEGK